MTTIHARTCHICEANCGVLMTVEDGKVTKVTGNPDHVLSEGYICPKATAIPDLQNDPDRLRSAMKRVGDKWEEVSWEQALSEIAAKHQAIVSGPKVGAMYMGNPNVHNYSSSFSTRGLIKAWGAKGIYSASTLDQLPHMICQKWVYGHNALYPVPDIDRTMYMLCIGGNPLACAAANVVVGHVAKPEMLARISELGERILSGLEAALKDSGRASNFRGKGQMMAFDVAPQYQGLMLEGLKQRVVLNVTGNNSIRLLPPYTLSDEEAELVLYAAPLHDIGKVGIPDRILLKPGKFEGNEFEALRMNFHQWPKGIFFFPARYCSK
mgnify:CR=1 FL=1